MVIKFAISAHVDSYEKTYNMIVGSLMKSGIDKTNIFFFVGGFDRYEKCENSHGVNMYYVDHNSMDFTGLVSVLDLDLESDYWFLLHDTTYVGVRFYDSILRFNHVSDTIKMTNDGKSMNIGSYKWSYLLGKKSDILGMKNVDYSEQGLQDIKRMNVFKEDFLFENNISYNTAHRKIEGPLDFYGNGVDRVVVYFSGIDLFKVAANWFEKPNYEIKL